jgi:hypothetical protein
MPALGIDTFDFLLKRAIGFSMLAPGESKKRKRDRQKAWYAANPDRVKTARVALRERMTPDQKAARKEYQRAWYFAHKEGVKAQKAEWRAANPEKVLGYARRRKYGVTSDQYQALYAAQRGTCKICKGSRPQTSPRGGQKPLAVDHCHATGRIRGLLCNKCNAGLGMLDDSIDLLRAALAYLEHT